MTHSADTLQPRRAHRALLALNAALAAAFVGLWVWPAPTSLVRTPQPASLLPESVAHAQATRPRGQYLIVSGRLNGMPMNAVYLFDSANMEMVAFRWDPSRNDLIGLGYRNVADDGKTPGGGR